MRLRIATSVFLIAVSSALSIAQESSQPVSFEVASIKPIQPEPPYANFFVEGNRFRGNHVTTAMIIARAYGVHREQLLGGPGWINSDRFNIDARAEIRLPAKSESGEFREPLIGMVQRLLAERFRLRIRHETREMPVLVLTSVRPERRTSIDRPKPIARASRHSFRRRRAATRRQTSSTTASRRI